MPVIGAIHFELVIVAHKHAQRTFRGQVLGPQSRSENPKLLSSQDHYPRFSQNDVRGHAEQLTDIGTDLPHNEIRLGQSEQK
jgi:hypothetical protein